jgi:hypothetical protein
LLAVAAVREAQVLPLQVVRGKIKNVSDLTPAAQPELRISTLVAVVDFMKENDTGGDA